MIKDENVMILMKLFKNICFNYKLLINTLIVIIKLINKIINNSINNLIININVIIIIYFNKLYFLNIF